MGWMILSVWLLVIVSGIVLLLLGLRGSSVTPWEVCRACCFNLKGLAGGTCPECGADLCMACSRRVVRRKREVRRALMGAVLIVAAAIVPGVLVADSVSSGRVTAVMPTWALVLQVRVLQSKVPDRVAQELIARCGNGGASDDALRAAAVAITQMHPGEALPTSLNQLVADAAAKGLIGKDLFAQHVVMSSLLYLQISERVRSGDPVAKHLVEFSNGKTRAPLDGSWIIVRRVVGVEVDGVAVTEASLIHRATSWETATTYTPTVTTTVVPPVAMAERAVTGMPSATPGKHSVRLRWSVEVYRGPGDTAPGRTTAWTAHQVEGVEAGAPLVRLQDDAEFKCELTKLLHADLYNTPGGGSWGISIKSLSR